MSSIDFAAAQQRVAARQEARGVSARARQAQQQDTHASHPISRLPYPVGIVGQKGLVLWDAIKSREGTWPAFRVGQVDAELLDEELLELLRGQVGDGLKYFGAHIRDDWSSEIQLVLRAILFKLSIWDHHASYGAALQNLQYTDARGPESIPMPPSRWQKAIYGVLSVGGRYGWEKWEDYLLDHEREAPRRIRLLSRFSNIASTTYSALAFISFLMFLVNGRYRTLLDRVLQMRLAPPSHQLSRQVSFEYLNRQLVWHAFTEFLLFLLPLVGISRWKRWITRAWRKTKNLTRSDDEDPEDISQGELAFLPERTCAICYKDQNPTSAAENEVMAVAGSSGGVVGSAQTDITNPYETTPCGCIYCYVCIATKLEAEEGEGWICLRCGDLIKECRPWAGDVLEDVLEDITEIGLESTDAKHMEVQGSYDNSGSKNHNGSLMSEETSEASPRMRPHWTREESDSGIDITCG